MTENNDNPGMPPTFTSPYRMGETIEAETVALAEAEARANEPTPQLIPFDPTKPTIDQTRAAAIDSIRHNFEALAPNAAADLTTYLKKTGDTALDLRIANPTTLSALRLDAIAGQVGRIAWQQASVNRFMWEGAADGSSLALYTFDNSGVLFSLPFLTTRSTQECQTGHNWHFGPIAGRNNRYTIDILKPYYAGVLIQEATTNAATVQFMSGGEIYHDFYVANAAGDSNSAVAGPKVHIRQQMFNGVTVDRLVLDPAGAINVAYGAIESGYQWQATVNGVLDFRKTSTIGVTAGSIITGFTFGQTGQVARILVAGAGAITLPASGVKLPQGGAAWGGLYTLVSVCNVDPAVTLLAFTPYD